MSEGSSLPTQDEDQDDQSSAFSNTSGIPYVLRLTPQGKYTLTDVVDFLEENWDYYIIGTEKKGTMEEHFHIVIDAIVDPRKTVQQFLYHYWPSRPRGWGNAQYNLAESTNEEKAISYASKMKDYQFAGYTEEYIAECAKKSFVINKVANFSTEFQKLNKDFQEDLSMDLSSYMTSFQLLKAKYGQPINMSQAYNYGLSALVKRDPSEADNNTSSYLRKYNNY